MINQTAFVRSVRFLFTMAKIRQKDIAVCVERRDRLAKQALKMEPEPSRRHLPLQGDIYMPSKVRGALMLFHGMTRSAERDQRIVNLACALSRAAGYLVWVPHLPEMAAQHMDDDDVERHAEVISASADWIIERFRLKPGILAPSYIGMLSLDALGRDPRLQEKIAAIGTIGAAASASAFQDFALRHTYSGDFGRLVFAKNICRQADMLSEGLRSALDYCLANCGAYVEPSAMVEAGASLGDEDRDLLATALDQARLRDHPISQAYRLPDFQLPHSLEQIRIPVFVLHGKTDRVVPASHAEWMARHLIRAPHRLCVTGILGHGDTRFDAKLALDLVRLVRGWGFYFSAIDRG